jgi:Holliday junction resolvase-like predicted endonuclease
MDGLARQTKVTYDWNSVGMPKLTSTQVGRAAEHYVVAEIHRRGGYAACFGGNMPEIDVIASDADHHRTVTIQVKAKKGGVTWQTSTTRGRQREAEETSTRFWVMVDLTPEIPVFYVMPEWWIQNNIYEVNNAYLARHGGKRSGNADSKHHKIELRRIEQWRVGPAWDLPGGVTGLRRDAAKGTCHAR